MTTKYPDPRAVRDRFCPCGNPITRYSKTGNCADCARGKTQECTRCGRMDRGRLCQRCKYHDQAPRHPMASKPTDAQRQAWGMSKYRTSTMKKASPLEGSCVHHWIVDSLPVSDGVYGSRCKLCGASKELRPWAIEDEGREKVSQRMKGS